MSKITVALLDGPAASGKGMFVRMETLDEEDLTDRHVPTITDCDLPPNRYVWVPEAEHQYGGEFVDEAVLELKNAPSGEQAFHDLARAVSASGVALPDSVTRYLDFYVARKNRLAKRNRRG